MTIQKKNKTEFIYTYSEYYEGGEVIKGQEHNDWPEHENKYKDWTLNEIYYYTKFIIKNPYWDSFAQENFDINKIKNGQVYALIVKYEDGDTFGHSYGNGTVAGVYVSLEEAEKAKLEIEQNKFNENISYRWTGYFNKLESVEICPKILT